ncbi:uncharacterized protein VTP21DRAFT_6849 [Calcarisporiella thermophila]|uniref:uncharacterized protein n=1 Tax=Calcarisporiella thermophila TaxID=911321 RepID=UPI003742C14D
MNSSQISSSQRPGLHGFQVKQRKSAAKAQAKYEPEIFRDNLLEVINSSKPEDLDDLSQKLDAAGNELDYRKYGDTFFEVLITGGVIGPGGDILDPETRSPYCIFAAEESAIKGHVEVIRKTIRRYKYLQKALTETLKHVLQLVNRWSEAENVKLGIATALFISVGLVSAEVLAVLFKDHLLKDGYSLRLVTVVFKTFLTDQSIDQLGSALTKGGIEGRLLEFFPPNKRNSEYFTRYFEASDLRPLVDYHNKKQLNERKERFLEQLREMISDEDATPQGVASYAKQQIKESNLPEHEVAQLFWEALMTSVDWSNRPELVESQAKNQINKWAGALAEVSTTSRTELLLLQKVQIWCYEDAKLLKAFRALVQLLYKHDVLSEGAILYWAEKGAKPQGKTVFLKQMEPLLQWLKNAEEEDDEDEDEKE